ncbi:hypothetical protein Nepgr_004533 [Nepenthes gracilis]|uniref:Uncharacterized protein n=1 Tax=Nepenthes gracilis TaxID=150966 RepID=A0AAD3S1V0_NEPGR|nr:hypothetical protein Nepgr_004533 [Nepenthes gracilis]
MPTESSKEVQNDVQRFYQNLLGSLTATFNREFLYPYVSKHVPDHLGPGLIATISVEEVHKSSFSISEFSASSVNGLTAGFSKAAWETVCDFFI